MNPIDLKRVEFRHYLETCGVMDALSYALIKLYDEVDKPNDPVAFVRQHFRRSTDENETDISKKIEDMNANELNKKQEHELELARQEIAKLQRTLNSMSSKSPDVGKTDVEPNDEPNKYNEIFNDPKYDGTLIKKYLTEEIFKAFLKQHGKPSIIDCIAKVNALQANPFGVIVFDANCYDKFTDLFEPIIKDIHCVDEFNKYPDFDWGDTSVFEILNNEIIVSIEINCYRSMANIPFIPGINEQDLEFILTKVQNAIQSIQTDDKEIDGDFYKISDVKENEPIFEELQKSGIGFWSMNPQEHALWPTGRGIYVNCNRTQSILINEHEHLRFIAKEMNGDFGLVYKNLVELIGKFSNGLDFERHDKFGWLLTNLELLGTGISCKITIKLKPPVDFIDAICEKNHIKINRKGNDIENEHIFELTNSKTFGISEFECVKAFYENVKEILQMLTGNDSKTDTVNQNVNELNSKECAKNSNETNNDADECIEKTEIEQPAVVEENTAKNEENNEQKTEEESAQNEQVTIAKEVDDNGEKPQIEDNTLIPSESNDTNENNTENLTQGENIAPENDEANQNETNEIESNQQETVVNEIECPKEEENETVVEQTTVGQAEKQPVDANQQSAEENPTED